MGWLIQDRWQQTFLHVFQDGEFVIRPVKLDNKCTVVFGVDDISWSCSLTDRLFHILDILFNHLMDFVEFSEHMFNFCAFSNILWIGLVLTRGCDIGCNLVDTTDYTKFGFSVSNGNKKRHPCNSLQWLKWYQKCTQYGPVDVKCVNDGGYRVWTTAVRAGDHNLKMWNMSSVILKLVVYLLFSSGSKGQNMFTKEWTRGSKLVRNTFMHRSLVRQLFHWYLTFSGGVLVC